MKKQTSLIAYENILKELPRRQMQVFEKIHTFPGITIRETATKLKMKENAISGRFTELENKGVIKVCKGCKYFKDSKQPHSMYELIKK